MEHTNYQFKKEENNPFGKKYCDDSKILGKFCNTKRPEKMWMYALDYYNRTIYFENGKDSEYCKMNETLRQCDVGTELCHNSNFDPTKPEENRAHGKIKWSKYISLGARLKARYIKSTFLSIFEMFYAISIFFYLKILGFVKDAHALSGRMN